MSSLRYARFRFPRARATRAFSSVASESDISRAEASLKRFWKTVNVVRRDDGLVVTLDERPLKTPGGKPLILPHNKSLAASLIAHEWDSQTTLVKPYALPMTSLASRAIDSLRDASSRAEVKETIINYLDSDTVCFHHHSPPPLVKLQDKHWTPLLEWAREAFAVDLHIFTSILPQPQPNETKAVFMEAISNLDEWQLAALERGTMSSKSFIIGLALVNRHLTVDGASDATHVEVNSQIERWGEVEDTHDVDYRDIRRQLGSAACLLAHS